MSGAGTPIDWIPQTRVQDEATDEEAARQEAAGQEADRK